MKQLKMEKEIRKKDERKKTTRTLLGTHKGGFYACVVPELVPLLENLSPAWMSMVEVVVAPKLMTEEEQEEMNAYEVGRQQAEEALELEKALTTLQVERWAEEDRRRENVRPAFPRGVLLERSMHELGL